MRDSYSFYYKIAALLTFFSSLLAVSAFSQCSISAGNQITACEGDQVTFTPSVSGMLGTVTYTYTNGVDSGSGLTTNALVCPPNANETQVFTITATDAFGCTASDEVNVNVDSQATATVVTTGSTCTADGSIEFTFENHPNRGTIQFSVDGGMTYYSSVPDNSGSETYALSAGSYSCYAKWGGNGNTTCPKDLGVFTVSEAQGVSLDVGDQIDVCLGSEVTVLASASGGSEPYSYTWIDGIDSGSGLVFTPTGDEFSDTAKLYTITVTDADGCSASAIKIINVRSLPVVTNVSTIDGCGTSGGVVFDFQDHPTRTTMRFTMASTEIFQTQVFDSSSSAFYNLPPDTYDISVSWDNDECPVELGTFTVNPSSLIDLNAGPDLSICAGVEVFLSPIVMGGQGPFTYEYSSGVINGTGLVFTPQGSALQNVIETYEITVTDAEGCESTDTIAIEVESAPSPDITTEILDCTGAGEITFEFDNHPNHLGIQFSLDGGDTYLPVVSDASGSVSYPLSDGVYQPHARFFGGICPTDYEEIEFIGATTYYAVQSGLSNEAIWLPEGGTVPVVVNYCPEINLVIDANVTVVADADMIANNVTVGNGNRLYMSEDSHDLILYGDLTVNGGQFYPVQGTVIFKGSTQQSINGANIDFHDVVMSNTSGLLLNSGMNVNGVFTPENGTFDVNGNQFTLVSELVNGDVLTGSIGFIRPAADFLGEIKIQRYVRSLEDGYRLIGVPIQNQTIEDFQGEFTTTGFVGSDYPNHQFTNVKWYDETLHHPTSIDSGFVDVTNITDPIHSERGCWAYFPPESQACLLESEGVFNKGDVTFNLSYTETGDDAFEGWHCIPNPYPSAIDINSADIVLNNVDRAIYILDHTLGGTWKGEYVIYNNGVSVNGGSNIVSSYQAFFIKATGPGASITFKEPCKSDDQGFFLRNGSEEKSLLRLAINQDQEKYESVVAFNELATEDFDPDFDAYKKNSTMFSMGTVSGGDTLSINTLPSHDELLEIPITVYAPLAGDYTISLDEVKNINTGLCLTLTDLETGQVHTLTEDEPVSFTTAEHNYNGVRFMLNSMPVVRVTTEAPSCANGNNGEIEIEPLIQGEYGFTLISDLGEDLGSESVEGNFILDNVSSGNYTLIITDEEGVCGTSELSAFVPAVPVLEPSSVSFLKDYCNAEEGEIFISAEHDSELTAQLYIQDELVSEVMGYESLAFQGLAAGTYDVVVTTECAEEMHTVDISNESMVVPMFNIPAEGALNGEVLTLELTSESENSLLDQWIVNQDIISQDANSSFTIYSPGVYDVTLRSTGADCVMELTKTIIVSEFSEMDGAGNDFSMTVNSDFIDINRTKGEKEFDRVEIFDVSGKLISSESVTVSSNAQLNHSGIASGAYIIRLSYRGEMIFSQLVSK